MDQSGIEQIDYKGLLSALCISYPSSGVIEPSVLMIVTGEACIIGVMWALCVHICMLRTYAHGCVLLPANVHWKSTKLQNTANAMHLPCLSINSQQTACALNSSCTVRILTERNCDCQTVWFSLFASNDHSEGSRLYFIVKCYTIFKNCYSK